MSLTVRHGQVQQLNAGKRTLVILPAERSAPEKGTTTTIHLLKPREVSVRAHSYEREIRGEKRRIKVAAHRYTAPMPGEGLAHVKVVDTYERTLDRIGLDEAKAAGFATVQELYAYWREKYHDGPGSKPRVVVVEIALDTQERPRYLDARWPDYTANPDRAMREDNDAVLAVDPATLARYAEENRERFEGDQIASLEHQLEQLRAWGQVNGINVSSEVRVLERRLRAKVRRAA